MPTKVLTVVGTRPEAVKFCPIVCATAQHREMLDQALSVFGVRPQHDLNIMSPGQSLAQITSRAVAGLDEVIGDVRPDITVVQGDTTKAFCGA